MILPTVDTMVDDIINMSGTSILAPCEAISPKLTTGETFNYFDIKAVQASTKISKYPNFCLQISGDFIWNITFFAVAK